ncbi:hypothetical protein D5086_010634 [Populus alba]|uniref:Uncharacterized protein n=1 Tax=Populus alba TaxID=43335 RepID=A0ACC4CAP6_POPAL
MSLFQIALGKCRNQEKCQIPKKKKNFDAEVNKKVWNPRRRLKLRNAERCFSLKYDDCKAETSVTTMLGGVLFQSVAGCWTRRIMDLWKDRGLELLK